MPAEKKKSVFLAGMRDGIPIGLGYLAVSFALGITAKKIGMTPTQGFFMSLFNNASAGEYAALQVMAEDAAYIQIILITLVTNARYLLMSASLSQKFSPDTKFYHRFLIGFDVTDELFGIMSARPSYLEPAYAYGAFCMALPGWAVGTALGIVAGDILPTRVVTALGVAIFGMFLAIIITPARKNKIIFGLVCVSFIVSALFYYTPAFKNLFSFQGGEGIKIIILTVIIAGAAAFLFPVKDENKGEEKE